MPGSPVVGATRINADLDERDRLGLCPERGDRDDRAQDLFRHSVGVGRYLSPDLGSASRRVNSSATDSWTRNRLAAVHASPVLRILASTAPSTAASRSAFEDDEGSVAAQLHQDSLQLLRRLLVQKPADVRGAGEGELADAGVTDERLTDLGRQRRRARRNPQTHAPCGSSRWSRSSRQQRASSDADLRRAV